MRHLLLLSLLLTLALPGAARAQDAAPTPRPGGGSAFQPLPPASQPEATPTPAPQNDTAAAQEDTDRRLLFGIAGGLLVLFVVIGYVITRDARATLPASA